MIDSETGEVVTPFIRTPYNYDTDKVSNATGTDTEKTRPGKTAGLQGDPRMERVSTTGGQHAGKTCSKRASNYR